MMRFLRAFLRELYGTDWLLICAALALAVFGILMIHSIAELSTRYAALPGQQTLHVVSGAALMFAASMVDYRLITRFYIPIYALCVFLLAAVLIIGADDVTGTARWLRLPLGALTLSVQPSELAKLFMALFLAKFLDTRRENFNHPLILLLYLALAFTPVVLILIQPSLSASAVTAVIALTLLFAAGLYLRTIVIGLVLTVPAAVFLILDAMRNQPLLITRLLSPGQWTRVQTFLNPVPGTDEALQITRSLWAVGTGGLYGKGYLNNTTYVIHGHNDFIFAVAAEQFGFIGCAALLAVMAFIIVKCLLVAYRAPDMLGRLIAAGAAGLLLFETFVNVGVVTALLPNTGMPLPFMSYGGTSMWVHLILLGVVVNVGKLQKQGELS
jgi:rod shape determining protein RodA